MSDCSREFSFGLEELMSSDKSHKNLTHLSSVANSASHQVNKTTDQAGERLQPINFRLTNQPVRQPMLGQLLSSLQAETKKKVTLGLFMSALVDVQLEILNNEEIKQKIVDAMRDI